MIQAYPLQWPIGYPRTQHRKQSRFASTLAQSRDELLRQIQLLGGTNVVISSNAVLRRDGLPLSKQSAVDDSGVAVYFTHNRKSVVMACDKWEEIGENIRAIGLTIEAIRGMDRWGVSQMIERTFDGFKALPAPKATQGIYPQNLDWHSVLNLKGVVTYAAVTEAYKKRIKEAHPDHGGSNDEFIAVQNAYKQAKEHYKFKV